MEVYFLCMWSSNLGWQGLFPFIQQLCHTLEPERPHRVLSNCLAGEGRGKEHGGLRRMGQDLGGEHHFGLSFRWPELSHVVSANCKVVGEMSSSYVFRNKRVGLVGSWLVSNIQWMAWNISTMLKFNVFIWYVYRFSLIFCFRLEEIFLTLPLSSLMTAWAVNSSISCFKSFRILPHLLLLFPVIPFSLQSPLPSILQTCFAVRMHLMSPLRLQEKFFCFSDFWHMDQLF